MGQKVHVSGFRVGIIKKHQSQWFARFNKNKYSQTVLEDRMIRDTLNKLFPELLNPSTDTKRNQNTKLRKSRITQIKIERSLVPYEITIQIHAEKCKLLKSAINNLQVKREILVKLQKTRQYLTNLKTKLDKLTNTGGNTDLKSLEQSSKTNERGTTKLSKIKALRKKLAKLKANSTSASRKQTAKTKRSLSQVLKIKLLRAKLAKLVQPKVKRKAQALNSAGETKVEKLTTKTLKSKKKASFKRKGWGFSPDAKLTKRQLKRQRIFKKRLRLRKFIRFRDRLLISKGLLLGFGKAQAGSSAAEQKTGQKLTKKLTLSPTPKFLKDFSLNPKVYLLPVQKIEKILKKGTKKRTTQKTTAGTSVRSSLQANIFNVRIQRKFVTLYIEQMKKKFLPHLNELFIQYTKETQNSSNRLSLGYLKKWDFARRVDSLKAQPIEKLERLVQNLRDKFVTKLNLLRKEFITFGSFTTNSSEILGLFQLYNFLINLKNLVGDLKRNLKHKIKARLAISKMLPAGRETRQTATDSGLNCLGQSPSWSRSDTANKLRIVESTNGSLPQKVFRKKLENISNEYRKMKFIEYLKDLVQQHRTNNIYLYLASLSESRKKLKEIKNEVKENLDFYLPGATSLKALLQTQSSSEESIQNATNEVNNILLKLAKKHPFDKTFSETKFEELERRRTMWIKNLQLMPKISIKFFSVNPKAITLKASVVSESIVDALEKRQAFRKVIKKAKEDLMRNSEIKGVKIQVAGRLNGAEMARTEWVRAGRVPLQTLRANLDYSYRTANTIYGIIGVKVWIFKGFSKLVTQE